MYIKTNHKLVMPHPESTKPGAQVDVEPGTVIQVEDDMGYDLVKKGAASQVDGPDDTEVLTDFTNLPKTDVPQPGAQDARYARPTVNSEPGKPQKPNKGPRSAAELAHDAVAPHPPANAPTPEAPSKIKDPASPSGSTGGATQVNPPLDVTGNKPDLITKTTNK